MFHVVVAFAAAVIVFVVVVVGFAGNDDENSSRMGKANRTTAKTPKRIAGDLFHVARHATMEQKK